MAAGNLGQASSVFSGKQASDVFRPYEGILAARKAVCTLPSEEEHGVLKVVYNREKVVKCQNRNKI